jgi:hypothetical protein
MRKRYAKKFFVHTKTSAFPIEVFKCVSYNELINDDVKYIAARIVKNGFHFKDNTATNTWISPNQIIKVTWSDYEAGS